MDQDKQSRTVRGRPRPIITGHCVLPQAVTAGQSMAILTDEWGHVTSGDPTWHFSFEATGDGSNEGSR